MVIRDSIVTDNHGLAIDQAWRAFVRAYAPDDVQPDRQKELANRPFIREQAFSEALDPDKLERLGRYEVHLDRKLERMLTMLLRLKDLRREG